MDRDRDSKAREIMAARCQECADAVQTICITYSDTKAAELGYMLEASLRAWDRRLTKHHEYEGPNDD